MSTVYDTVHNYYLLMHEKICRIKKSFNYLKTGSLGY